MTIETPVVEPPDTLSVLHQLYGQQKSRTRHDVDPDLHRDLEHGWLFPALVELDRLTWGRWQYWAQVSMNPVR